MPETFLDSEFPIFGIDLSDAYGDQRPQTTAKGVNVVAFEPSSGRARGGSRPGLTRFIDSQLTGPIQMLNVVISTSADALAAGIVTTSPPIIYGGAEPGNPGETDPTTNNGPIQRNPGRTIRDGGNGVTPNRNIPAPSPPPPPPPGTNRRVFKGSLSKTPEGDTTPFTNFPDLDPDGNNTKFHTHIYLATERGTVGLPGDSITDDGPDGFLTTTITTGIATPADWGGGGTGPRNSFAGVTDPNHGKDGGSDGLNILLKTTTTNNSILAATRAAWESLKASLGGDLRVLLMDRIGNLDYNLNNIGMISSPFSVPLDTVTIDQLNTNTIISQVFGTAADKVDYVPINYGAAQPGSSDYNAAFAAETAAIAAWHAAHP